MSSGNPIEKLKEQKWLTEHLEKKMKEDFYGEIHVTFHAGRVMHVTDHEKHLPPTRKNAQK